MVIVALHYNGEANKQTRIARIGGGVLNDPHPKRDIMADPRNHGTWDLQETA